MINLSCDKAINNLEIAEIVKNRLKSNSLINPVEAKNLFILNSDRAKEMGFISSSPSEIVNSYLDYFCAQNKMK